MIYDDAIRLLKNQIKYKISRIERNQMCMNRLLSGEINATIQMKIRAIERKQRSSRVSIDNYSEEIRQLKQLQQLQ